VKSIVAFHDRINRTAELVGIKLPKSRSRNKRSGYESSSESASLFDSDSSESDDSSVPSFRRSYKARDITDRPSLNRGGPPPPPPANWPSGPPPPPPRPWSPPSCPIPGPPPSSTMAGTTVNVVSSESNLVYFANSAGQSSVVLGK
jgi:hypothetical protein